MAGRFQLIAVNDDRDFCECCGKTGLKRVVWIQDIETLELKHFGTTCATSPVKSFGVDKELKAAIGNFNRRMQVVFGIAHNLYKVAGGTYSSDGDGGWINDNQSLKDECIALAKAKVTL